MSPDPGVANGPPVLLPEQQMNMAPNPTTLRTPAARGPITGNLIEPLADLSKRRPGEARSALEFIAQGKLSRELIGIQVASLRRDGYHKESGDVVDSKKVALAIDLEVAALQLEDQDYAAQADLAKSRQDADGLAKCNDERRRIAKRAKDLSDEREGKPQVKNEANQIVNLAIACGIDQKLAVQAPLGVLSNLIEGASYDPKQRIALMANLRSLPDLDAETNATINALEKYMVGTARLHNIETGAKKVQKIMTLGSLFMLLMLWVGKKDKRQQ